MFKEIDSYMGRNMYASMLVEQDGKFVIIPGIEPGERQQYINDSIELNECYDNLEKALADWERYYLPKQ